MIYTNEPANVYYVLLSAFRSNRDHLDNLSAHHHLVSALRCNAVEFGHIESTDLTGCYHEAGMESPAEEQTIRVRCERKDQAISIARLACNGFEQDCVLVYKSQTHAAGLIFAKGMDGWRTERIGSFQMAAQDAELTGNYTVDEFGRGWMVS
ncbi:hypothetical protein pEaSNUABM57_00016 [Erwinia phage pEa_SNUABM_57]|uniref:S-adenosyl-L-methionine hydrolase n=1 Tax=Erwinia phage pEa_SNUABM_57 TaxID=2996118 RepID=A0A9E9BWN5_9CAUD|nr:hypothetical protein pEaSNUABM57_00016 [Erwinia phage pEa_SNUABM_57]